MGLLHRSPNRAMDAVAIEKKDWENSQDYLFVDYS